MSAPANIVHARRTAAAHRASGPFGLLADPALPHLAAALDPEFMVQRFADGFAERARGPAPHVHACAVEEVYYRPGRHCGILYRLRLNGHDAPEREEWLYARMLPHDQLRSRYEKALDAVVAAGASALVSTALEPVSLWDRPGMLVWTFPNDPKLPGLRAMADPARVRRRLARARGALGLPEAPGAGRGGPHAFDRVKYMPTKRCVLRFHVGAEGMHADGAAPFVFYAKAYPAGESEAAFRMQRAARGRLAAAHATVELAEPLVHLADESAIWFSDWGGRGLVSAAAEHGWDAMADRAAAALAEFHGVEQPGLPAYASLAGTLDEAREDAKKYAARVPSHSQAARGIVARLERRLPTGQVGRPAVALHGAFRAEHVLVRGAHTALLDLDGMALGDPLVDAAEFVASLEFLALRSAPGAIDAERVSRRFLARYAAAVPWAVDGASLAWHARVSILRKLHGAVKRLARPTLERLESEGARLATRWGALEDWTPPARTSSVARRTRTNGVAP
jgi:aminoglycoside phosphotransferase (APT) family kinase protein